MNDILCIETEVLRLIEVSPTDQPLEAGYWGVAAYSDTSCLIRAAATRDELAALAGDLADPVALFRLAQREYPLGNLDGSAMSGEETFEWMLTRTPLPDPKPFVAQPGYPTQTELLRIETVDVGSGDITDVAYGIAARGPLGEAIARISPTLKDLADIISIDDHADRFACVAALATIGTVDGRYVNPAERIMGFQP